MDIKWKDIEGNIINADIEKIKIKKSDLMQTYLKSDIHRIEINDHMLMLYDSKDNLLNEITIPAKKLKEAVKIFNAYDKTGRMFKITKKSGDFTFFETLVTSGDPIGNVVGFVILVVILCVLYSVIIRAIFGKLAPYVAIGLLCSPFVAKFITYVKRQKLKEIR